MTNFRGSPAKTPARLAVPRNAEDMTLFDVTAVSGAPSNLILGVDSKTNEGAPETAGRQCKWCSGPMGTDPRTVMCSRGCASRSRAITHSAGTELTAAQILHGATARGWQCVTIEHPVQGWCVEAILPGLNEPVLLTHPDDLAWLLIDLGGVA